jgi:hypothetical protein
MISECIWERKFWQITQITQIKGAKKENLVLARHELSCRAKNR